MKIQVLGSGCPTCKRLHEITEQAAKELNIKEDVEYITDIQKIIEMGVMSSPILAINGKPVLAGEVPSVNNIKKLIDEKREAKKDGFSKGCCSCGSKG
jgi:small redox-active disulfide protein 2